MRIARGVVETLFADYSAHRSKPGGERETGWILLGERHGAEAVARAAIPAGARGRRELGPREI